MKTSDASKLLRETQRVPGTRVTIAVRYDRIARESARDARRTFLAEQLINAVIGTYSRTELRAMDEVKLAGIASLRGITPSGKGRTAIVSAILDAQKEGSR